MASLLCSKMSKYLDKMVHERCSQVHTISHVCHPPDSQICLDISAPHCACTCEGIHACPFDASVLYKNVNAKCLKLIKLK